MALVEHPTEIASTTRLQDSHGRVIRKLRVSLLDACNMRCGYCMPLQMKFAKQSRYLSTNEWEYICRSLVDLGIEQIRVTGGEPTLHPHFKELMAIFAQLPLQKLGLTSNGLTLAAYLDDLKEMGCQHLNISLDSLNPETFTRISHAQGFEQVKQCILKAHQMGFQVKINTVIMGGVNDHEIPDFVEFSEQSGIEVRFLELMRIGEALAFQSERFVTAKAMIQRIASQRELIPVRVDWDSTSFNYRTPAGGQIGFIASESQAFCHSCSRLRLSYDGTLRPCLMLDQGLSLRGKDKEQIRATLYQVMEQKPYERVLELAQSMNQIGG